MTSSAFAVKHGCMGLFLATIFSNFPALSQAGRSAATNDAVAYHEFRLFHRSGDAEEDSVSYAEREALFHARAAEVAEHNAENKSWTLALNHFADYTESEKRFMLGYKRVGGRWAKDSSSFLQTSDRDMETIDVKSLAKSVDWRSKMNFSNFVHNQGACGSCWAHAAVGALEAHAEITTGLQTELATQEIIDCSPNPRHCGGTGGCEGATAEIAFELARDRGISKLSDYTAAKGECPGSSSSALQVKSFTRLAENKATHLLNALATKGPVVMSVAAENLFMYNAGVFSGCQPDAIVNHAVLGVGYGNDPSSGKDYWLIKNSWGAGWGEEGYFKLERFNEDSAHCGTDVKPQDGVYCDKHPAKISVCGMCGSTSDSAYPVISPKTSLRQQGAHVASKVSQPDVFPVL